MEQTLAERPIAPRHTSAASERTPTASGARVHALGCLRGVSLADLDQAQLHDRVETKLVMHADGVGPTLLRLSDDYLVMDHEGNRTQRYSNTYLDTAGLRNYFQHHNQKRQRSKIRYRTYVDSGLTFFEIKRNVDGRTVKERKISAPVDGAIRADDIPFLRERSSDDPRDLEVAIVIDYERILLVRQDFQERVTIDTNLRFQTRRGAVMLPGLAIVEFKQPRLDRNSPAVRAIPRPTQMFSKYCMGLASCDPNLKRNRFKKVFRGMESLNVTPQLVSRAA